MHNEWQNNNPAQLKKYKAFLQKAEVKKTIQQLGKLHEAAFSKFDCLDCGNCCRNYSPRFKTPDIKRIAHHLKIKESAFIEKYLRLDEDGDYVTQTAPCPFLSEGNKCTIYESRPSDCRRFPYTDEDIFVKRKNITLKNVTFCPIANDVMKNLTEKR